MMLMSFKPNEELSGKLLPLELYNFPKLEPRPLSPDMNKLHNFFGTDLPDPTPIGTKGIKIVEKIDLMEARWAHDTTLVDCLSGFLKRKQDDAKNPELFTSRQKNFTRKTEPQKRQRAESFDDASSESSSSSKKSKLQIRAHQTEQWYERHQELVEFQREHGHCVVPYHFTQNLPLALWVKRQRHQYKLKKEGSHSTMTDDREKALGELGFVWDSHKAVWQERLNELICFRNELGHCNVPAKFPENPQLAIWVKCQRRQYKLYCDGDRSNITLERIQKLSREGLVWNPRKIERHASLSRDDFV